MKNYLKNRGENAWQIGSFLLILCAKISIMSLKPMRWLKKDITMQEWVTFPTILMIGAESTKA